MAPPPPAEPPPAEPSPAEPSLTNSPGAEAGPAVAQRCVRRFWNRERIAIWIAASVVSLLILGPLLRSGYVLSYDMVFVPKQPLRWDLLAPVDSVPRAVPLDAAVSFASLVLPGWLLQRLILVGIVCGAVTGAARLVPAQRLSTRLVAGVCYGWTPFFAERLLIGQWGLLVAYACLPWLILALRRYRLAAAPSEAFRLLAPVALAAGLSAITPTGGVIAAVVAIAFVPGRFAVYLILAALNSPWIVAALLSDAGTRSDPAGVAAFAVRAESEAGVLLTLLGTGGIWNRDTTPGTRTSMLAVGLTIVLVVGAVYGYRRLRTGRWAAVAAGGFVLALASAVPWGQTALVWLVGNVPGAGMLRDAHKFLMPYTLLLVVCFALGVERLAEGKLRDSKLPNRRLGDWLRRNSLALFAIAATAPVLVMPDLAFGGWGALRPVQYPSEWDRVAGIVESGGGEVLSVPLAEYRAYPWNGYRPVIDVAPRYLAVPVLTDDRLIVLGPDGQVVAGENPRVRIVREKLASNKPLRDVGFHWILIQGNPTNDVAANDVAANDVAAGGLNTEGLVLRHRGEFLELYENPDAPAQPVHVRNRPVTLWPTVLSELLALMVIILAMRTMAWNRF